MAAAVVREPGGAGRLQRLLAAFADGAALLPHCSPSTPASLQVGPWACSWLGAAPHLRRDCFMYCSRRDLLLPMLRHLGILFWQAYDDFMQSALEAAVMQPALIAVETELRLQLFAVAELADEGAELWQCRCGACCSRRGCGGGALGGRCCGAATPAARDHRRIDQVHTHLVDVDGLREIVPRQGGVLTAIHPWSLA